MPGRRRISAAVRRQITERDTQRCAYCRSPMIVGIPMGIEHIIPLVSGGSSTPDNLCLACYRCNRSTGSDLTTFDPLSNALVPLFNPRQHTWSTHFILEDASIVGLTPIGRATVVLLKLNAPTRLLHRRMLIAQGRYT